MVETYKIDINDIIPNQRAESEKQYLHIGDTKIELPTLLTDNIPNNIKPNQRGGRPKKYENGWDSVKSDYMRKYAKEKLIGSFFCPSCNLEFLYKTSVNSHMKKSKKCNIIRLEKELEEARKQKQVLKIGDLDKGIKLD